MTKVAKQRGRSNVPGAWLRLIHNRYPNMPTTWQVIALGKLLSERREHTSDLQRFHLHSFTIEDGVTKKTDRYYREFLLRDKETNQYLVAYPGDLVYNPMNLRFGAIALCKTQRPVAISAYYHTLVLDQGLFAPSFMEALLRSHEMLTLVDTVAIGSLVEKRRVHLSLFERTPIPLPPLAEQRKIGDLLSTWDQAIKQTAQLIEVKTERKNGLMQSLLTAKKRLPGFQKAWEWYHLQNLFAERNETGCAHLPLLAITGDRGVIPASEIERKDSSSEDKSKYKRIASGDIGYNTMRMWQGVSAVSELEGIVSPAYTICNPKNGGDVRFMGYLFKFPPVVHSFWRHSQGLVSDTLNLKFHHFARIKVKIPTFDE